ncbi:hypothetical protein [Helicobacter jaachi]|nr:hypothetical protein [Helicobacter jaachi]
MTLRAEAVGCELDELEVGEVVEIESAACVLSSSPRAELKSSISPPPR